MKKLILSALVASVALTGCQTVSNVANQAIAPVKQTQNIKNAKALIQTFTTGDVAKAKSLLGEDYIQHNLAVPTGVNGFIGAVEGLSKAPSKTTVQTVRAFTDGDKVVLHNIYNFAGQGEQVAFDIFRFDNNGKIVEHWDNLSSLAKPNPSGRTQTDGVSNINSSANSEQTRKIVSDFVHDVLHGKNLANFTGYFDGNNYIQHNSQIADGVSGLSQALEAMAKQGITMKYHTTHQVLAQGDFALAVSEGEFAGKPTAFYDLFRVENGKIAEHWDIIEPIADPATWQHQNGKF